MGPGGCFALFKCTQNKNEETTQPVLAIREHYLHSSYIWDFNNLHVVLWICKQARQRRRSATGLDFFYYCSFGRRGKLGVTFKRLCDRIANISATRMYLLL